MCLPYSNFGTSFNASLDRNETFGKFAVYVATRARNRAGSHTKARRTQESQFGQRFANQLKTTPFLPGIMRQSSFELPRQDMRTV